MKLYEGEIGEKLLVQEVMIEERLTRRLEALGVNEHTKVTVLNKKKKRNPDYQRQRDETGAGPENSRWNRDQGVILARAYPAEIQSGRRWS